MNIEQLAADVFGKIAGHVAKQLSPIVERLEAVESRQPEKGEKGDPGERGADGLNGSDGADGQSISIEEVEKSVSKFVDSWALDFERRAHGILERAVDRLPKPADGKDGRDGFGFDDMQMEFDGERGFSLKFMRGDQVRSFDFSLPVPVYRGVYKEGESYSKCDTATWGGSVWIAQKDTNEKPGRSDDWQLMVKQGNEGKSAFAIAQERGFTGTKQEWVNSLYPVGETIVKVKP
jgi:integrin beta 3